MEIEYQILLILFIHWIADFVLQTKSMGTLKSSSLYWLTLHVITYTTVWFIAGRIFGFGLIPVIKFSIVTFIIHWITDFFTSRWTKSLRENEKYYNFLGFFTVIGLDQWLHYVQLILTYKFLK